MTARLRPTRLAGSPNPMMNAMGQNDTRGPNNMPSDEQRKAMRELSKSLRAKAHFRYPIDGPGVIDQAITSTLDEIFGSEGPNSAQNRWVRRIRRLGLIR
jgi:hypothetical protein